VAIVKEKLSVIVPTFNEERNVGACLESVRFADEILVVDSFSTDRTLEVARPLATRLLEHAYVNSAAQKNWAIPQAAHRWVLIVDADEQVSPELAEEIRGLLAAGPPHDGYVLRRLNHFHGKPIRHGGWGRDRVLRLFDRGKARYEEKDVHAEVEVRGSVSELVHPLLHETFTGFADYLEKMERYTRWGADDLHRRGRRARVTDLIVRPPLRFAKRYLLQGGFLDGMEGLMITGIDTWSVFLKYARLWEKEKLRRP
jgi:glycosyltransferase involved in cell wall biosynthesis